MANLFFIALWHKKTRTYDMYVRVMIWRPQENCVSPSTLRHIIRRY